jgi:hypothetical protein
MQGAGHGLDRKQNQGGRVMAKIITKAYELQKVDDLMGLLDCMRYDGFRFPDVDNQLSETVPTGARVNRDGTVDNIGWRYVVLELSRLHYFDFGKEAIMTASGIPFEKEEFKDFDLARHYNIVLYKDQPIKWCPEERRIKSFGMRIIDHGTKSEW